MNARLEPRERAVVAACRTPRQVQRFVDGLAYNRETDGETLMTFRGVVRTGRAHCAEGALAAAFLLERLGHEPLLLSQRSPDYADHLVALFRARDGRWGGVAMSKYPGLRGRKALYPTVEALNASYAEPFVDETGSVQSWAVVDLRNVRGDWRLGARDAWGVQRLVDLTRHSRAGLPDGATVRRWRRRYVRWKAARGALGDLAVQPPVAFYRGLARVVL